MRRYPKQLRSRNRTQVAEIVVARYFCLNVEPQTATEDVSQVVQGLDAPAMRDQATGQQLTSRKSRPLRDAKGAL